MLHSKWYAASYGTFSIVSVLSYRPPYDHYYYYHYYYYYYYCYHYYYSTPDN